MIRFVLLLACLLAPLASAAQQQPPRYLIAIWDGSETRAGAWFTVDGAELPRGVVLRRVEHLPEGVVIDAEAGRLVLSSDLALILGVEPETPTLIEIAGPDLLGPSPPGVDEAVAAEERAAARTVMAENERIGALLEELRLEAVRSEAVARRAALRNLQEPPIDKSAPEVTR